MSTTTQRSSNVRALMLLVLTGIVVLLASKGSNAKPDESPPVRERSLSPRLPGPDIPIDYQLRLGPIEGLTTGWHLTSPEMSLPMVAMELFHYSVPPDVSVTWKNAIEIARDEWGSTALCPFFLQGAQPQAIEVYLVDADGAEWTASCTITVLEATIESIEITQPQVWVDEILIDEDLPEDELNQVTMQYFFRENSIAALTDLGDGRYRTSVTRDVYVSVDVTPPEFAPLIEWRIDGDARKLGATSVLQVTEIGNFQIDAGPPQIAEGFELETYRVTITSHIGGEDIIEEGEPVLFIAETDPPGYESEITWLSSTLYGTGEPILGSGPMFIVQFDDTWGPWPADPTVLFQWLGVRGDNTSFNQDQKCDCPDNADEAAWNTNAATKSKNNCYNYGANQRNSTFAQPGHASGSAIPIPYTELNCADMAARAVADKLVANGNSTDCPPLTCLVALFAWLEEDYHWYRKNDDGKWSHKPGMTAATTKDQSGDEIGDDIRAAGVDTGNYCFCQYMCVPCDVTISGLEPAPPGPGEAGLFDVQILTRSGVANPGWDLDDPDEIAAIQDALVGIPPTMDPEWPSRLAYTGFAIYDRTDLGFPESLRVWDGVIEFFSGDVRSYFLDVNGLEALLTQEAIDRGLGDEIPP